MPKVLYIGFDQALSMLTSKMLIRNGYEVDYAISLDEAYNLMEQTSFDIVVADTEYERTSPIDFCKDFKDKNNDTKLLLISNNHEDEASSLNAGADDFIKKPYKMNVLYARIRALLR